MTIVWSRQASNKSTKAYQEDSKQFQYGSKGNLLIPAHAMEMRVTVSKPKHIEESKQRQQDICK